MDDRLRLEKMVRREVIAMCLELRRKRETEGAYEECITREWATAIRVERRVRNILEKTAESGDRESA